MTSPTTKALRIIIWGLGRTVLIECIHSSRLVAYVASTTGVTPSLAIFLMFRRGPSTVWRIQVSFLTTSSLMYPILTVWESRSQILTFTRYKSIWWFLGVADTNDVIQKIEKTLNNTHTTTQKLTNNSFRNTKKHPSISTNIFVLRLVTADKLTVLPRSRHSSSLSTYFIT